MNRISVSVLALALTAAAGSAVAAYQDYGSRYDNNNTARSDYAQVISVQPVYDRYAQQGYQRQECWNEQTNNYDNGYYRDSNGRLYQGNRDSNVNGTVIGALIGGALGNQVGKGDGRKAATIGGAVIGGVIGNNVDRNNNNNYNNNYDQYQDNSGTVRRCRTVTAYDNNDNGGQVSGYNVTYRYAGQTYHSVTTRRPGRTIRVIVDVRAQDEVRGYRNDGYRN